MQTNLDWNTRRNNSTPRGVSVMASFYADRARNAELWDVEGRRFIDFGAGIAVLNTGHGHPRVVEAVSAQLQRFSHTAYQVVPYGAYVELAEKLCRLTPGSHAKKAALFTTGAEAVENAVKIARAATGRSAVIAFSGAFHGRTMMGMALTGKVDPYKLGFGPFPGEVWHAPFPAELLGVTVEQSLQAIETLFKADVEPRRVAAIIIEPVQGEGGFYVAPPRFLRALRELCNRHGIIFIADEIQTGFARTGKLFAMEHSGVLPDLMAMAKSLAGGLPLSAVCGRAELMDGPNPGGLGGTYAGNPLAVAAAHAVLDIIEEQQLCARAAALGERVTGRLADLSSKVPHIAQLRALGSMIALEFRDPASGAPDGAFARKVQAIALERGLILLTCGSHGQVIRLLYPLTIEDRIMDEGLAILEGALREAAT